MSRRPLRIGLSARIYHPQPGATGLQSKSLQYLEQSVAHWVMSREVMVFMIPAVSGDGIVHRSSIRLSDYPQYLDGLVLQGGADIDPQFYGEQVLQAEWAGDRLRDAYEMELLHEFMEAGRPVLGICRGAQLINVALGGTLYQDIATQYDQPEIHVHDDYDKHAHTITWEAGSGLSKLYPEIRGGNVISIHHQAIKALGKGLRIEARSTEDGLIEAIRLDGKPYVLGLQWHPEFHPPGSPDLLNCNPVLDEFLAEREAGDGDFSSFSAVNCSQGIGMIDKMISPLRAVWESLLERLFFLPFPESIDSLALFSLLLVVGLLIGEWLHAHAKWPKVIGYVLAGIVFGPSLLGWISIEALAQARPIADAALGLLMMEVGRRLDLNWLRRNPELLRSTFADITLSFALIFIFALWFVDLTPAWAAATAAVTMASAPAVVLLTIEEAKAQGQVTERIILHTAIGSAASFVAFAFVLGIVHAELSEDWLNAIVHPLWVVVGAFLVGGIGTWLALSIAKSLPKRSLAQVFVLVACALLAVGIARMLAVPVFLTLFLMGVLLAARDRQQTLRYTALPEGHWLLAIVLFVIVGASLPWQEFTWLAGLQALGLLLVRAAAKAGAIAGSGGSLSLRKRLLVGMGIQPLSATAVFMAYEIASLYPEVGRSALTLPLFSAAMMELAGPALCRWALHRSGECEDSERDHGGIA